MSVKNFLKTYGTVGIGVYGAVTIVNMSLLYLGMKVGGDHMLLSPLEKVLGSESPTFQSIQRQLGDASCSDDEKSHNATSNVETNKPTINWVREGTYVGVATAVDSLMLPLKLPICLPLAAFLLKRRGR